MGRREVFFDGPRLQQTAGNKIQCASRCSTRPSLPGGPHPSPLQPPLHQSALLLGLCAPHSQSAWRAPHAQAHLLSRCWCLYEMWSTLMGKGPQALQILLPGGESKGFLSTHQPQGCAIMICMMACAPFPRLCGKVSGRLLTHLLSNVIDRL